MQPSSVWQKINALIKSKQASNNYLAVSLMQTQLNIDFETAFRNLYFVPVEVVPEYSGSKYEVNILDFKILFELKHCWATIKEYPFLEITRLVYRKKEEIVELKRCFTVDFFESETERDMFEAMHSIPVLGNGIEQYLSK